MHRMYCPIFGQRPRTLPNRRNYSATQTMEIDSGTPTEAASVVHNRAFKSEHRDNAHTL